ncbi:MAG: hypothetical protein M3Q07_21675, partial [Pseudobdellovibrionaceae bacterium]|nr:hypothetical protein [Pseudobdellovibrionaceae bacterium]
MAFFETYCAKNEAEYQKICLGLDLSNLASPHQLPDTLMLNRSGDFSVYYAPMSIAIPNDPKLFIVGLTPGWSQAMEAYARFAEAKGDLDLFKKLSESIAFKGTMRSGIYGFFEEIGITARLNLCSSDQLFSSDLCGSTSILRYPVFKGESLQNYSGSSFVLKDPFLMAMV